MKIFENNLKNFIDIPNDIDTLTNAYITEVESFKQFTNITNLVVGYVSEKTKHENADSLSVTKVDLGDGTLTQIVCGAKNVDKGQYVIVAKEGAVLPGDFVIKKSKIRGVESNGMICSLKELGIDEKLIPDKFKEGIYVFEDTKEIGSNPLIHLALDGFVLELSLTPNRSDLLSHYGYANDLAAVLNEKITMPSFKITESDLKNPLTVTIESNNTNSYYARYLSNIVVSESPWWLKNFLVAMDCKPINTVVDITNYILYTYGIPMHAFDADTFNGNDIVVRDNESNLEVITLDGEKHILTGEEIVITNGKEIMALGGVMGLENSMITDNTKSIILEVASFDRNTTRKTSKKLNLKSDSSLRFERGIDESIMLKALDHATFLLQTLANAKVHQGISSIVVNKTENKWIDIDLTRVIEKIGNSIKDSDIYPILERLNYDINYKDNKVKAPSYRNDIEILDDVIEEIVRIYGMDNIAGKALKNSGIGKLSLKQKINRSIRNYLSSVGLNEVITYSLLRVEDVKKYNDIGEIISIIKPLNAERKALRQSQLNGLVEVLNYNLDRNNKQVSIFEIGHIYAKGIEENYLSILVNSSNRANLWKKLETKIDFYYVSGLLKNLMSMLNINYELVASNKPNFHPYQQALIQVSGISVGFIAKLHPKDNDAFIFELNLDAISKKEIVTNYSRISKYPNIERDIAIVLKETIKVKDIIDLVKQTAKKTLINVEVFDLYKGDHIEKGLMSLAIRLTFNDKEKTLLSEEVDKLVGKIVKRIEFEFEGKIRS